MRPFESLLPHIAGRIAASGETGKAGRMARLDNDLYVHPSVLTGPDNEAALWLAFYLFFNNDGSHAKPAFQGLGDLLTIHLGYDVTFPGGILGDPLVRQELRRLKDAWGWRSPSLTLTRVMSPRAGKTEMPPWWTRLGLLARPGRRASPDGYDWPILGSEIVGSADEILRLLDMARPTTHAPGIQPS